MRTFCLQIMVSWEYFLALLFLHNYIKGFAENIRIEIVELNKNTCSESVTLECKYNLSELKQTLNSLVWTFKHDINLHLYRYGYPQNNGVQEKYKGRLQANTPNDTSHVITLERFDWCADVGDYTCAIWGTGSIVGHHSHPIAGFSCYNQFLRDGCDFHDVTKLGQPASGKISCEAYAMEKMTVTLKVGNISQTVPAHVPKNKCNFSSSVTLQYYVSYGDHLTYECLIDYKNKGWNRHFNGELSVIPGRSEGQKARSDCIHIVFPTVLVIFLTVFGL